MASPACTSGRRARAASIRSISGISPSGSRAPTQSSSTWNASRSNRAAGVRSSSAAPSSRAIRAKGVVSSAAAKRPAKPDGARSAIASSTTPPSASASNPRSATGRPAARVAARSSPPSKRPSPMVSGILRQGAPSGSSPRSRASHRVRTGPCDARSDTPPVPAGSTAISAAAWTASAQGLPGGAASVTPRTGPPRPAPPAPWTRRRPAGPAAAGAARRWAPRATDG